MTLALAGLFAAVLHVLSGPDHLAAVAPYAVAGKTRAWRTGVQWGLGHSAGVLGVGLLALTARSALPLEALSQWGERCVGVVLLGIGIFGIHSALARRADHQRPLQPLHGHGRAPFAVGTLHGLAGSSHFLGIVPALALPSDFAAAVYLVFFGVGSVAAMGTFSSLVGWLAARRAVSSVGTQGALLALCSAAAMAVGAFWLIANWWGMPLTGSGS